MDDQTIHEAAQKGDVAKLKQLLSEGVNVDLPGYSQWTPLIYAAWNGKLEAVKFLVEQKASVDQADGGKGTA